MLLGIGMGIAVGLEFGCRSMGLLKARTDYAYCRFKGHVGRESL